MARRTGDAITARPSGEKTGPFPVLHERNAAAIGVTGHDDRKVWWYWRRVWYGGTIPLGGNDSLAEELPWLLPSNVFSPSLLLVGSAAQNDSPTKNKLGWPLLTVLESFNHFCPSREVIFYISPHILRSAYVTLGTAMNTLFGMVWCVHTYIPP